MLLAIDALAHRLGDQSPESLTMTSADLDEAGLRASARRLVDLAAREGATIVHGHDAERWRELRTSPEFYA